MQDKKVTIEVSKSSKGSHAQTPEVRYRKRNHNPASNNFKFMPKAFNHLDAYVCNLDWDSVNKQIHLAIKETPDFDVVRWMEFLSEQYHELQKSPFVDVDQSTVLIIYMDDQNNELAKLGLKNLSIAAHHCSVYHNDQQFGLGSPLNLIHRITLGYQYSEIMYGDNPLEAEPAGDKEWQEVKAP